MLIWRIRVENRSKVYRWFWNRPLFRNLGPRLMTMVLVLVMPLSLISLVISVISVSQSMHTSYEIGYNGMSFFLDQIALRQELGDIDIIRDFPGELSAHLCMLYGNAWAEDPGNGNGGSVYTTKDGKQAFLVHSDGAWEVSDQPFDELLKAKYQYYWHKEGQPFQVLVTFPYNFALRNIPTWFWIAILISLMTMIACPLLYIRLRHDILNPMRTMSLAIDTFREDRDYRIPPQSIAVSNDFLRLFDEFNAMAAEVKSSYEKDIRLLETEMDNLRLQVNPHMLLNSYNMIYALAESKNYATIQDYTLCLVEYFRYVLRKGQQQVTLRQELEFVDNFIRIQRIRFPGRFSYIYKAGDDCLDARIPPLLIENFVENSIKYALNPQEPIEIIVSVYRETDSIGKEKLHIAITDTGSGIRPEVLKKLEAHEPYVDAAGQKHIGIWNCIRRIELFYGEEGSVHFSSGEGKGTQVYLTIPCLTDRNEKEGNG